MGAPASEGDAHIEVLHTLVCSSSHANPVTIAHLAPGTLSGIIHWSLVTGSSKLDLFVHSSSWLYRLSTYSTSCSHPELYSALLVSSSSDSRALRWTTTALLTCSLTEHQTRTPKTPFPDSKHGERTARGCEALSG